MKRPWMPVYIGDYLRDTGHLRAAAHGAYLLLLFHCWTKGSVPDDDRQLCAIACCDLREWTRHIAPLVRPFFHLIDGRLHQGRVDKETKKASNISEKRRIASLARKTCGAGPGRGRTGPNGSQKNSQKRAIGVSSLFSETSNAHTTTTTTTTREEEGRTPPLVPPIPGEAVAGATEPTADAIGAVAGSKPAPKPRKPAAKAAKGLGQPNRRTMDPEMRADFETWWTAWPRALRHYPDDAAREYALRRAEGVTAEVLLDAVRRHNFTVAGDYAHRSPRNWLRGGGFDNDEATNGGPPAARTGAEHIFDFVRRHSVDTSPVDSPHRDVEAEATSLVATGAKP